ncbi:LysR family transcriptional regulator [Streptomyces sp. P8-A8]|nr:LysR family transcriptional regulator [Streptomyces sp. NBC_01243]
MDLRVLSSFLAVVEEGHFGRAAARLFLPPPAVTQHVRRPENELGTRLLHRHPSRPLPPGRGWPVMLAPCSPQPMPPWMKWPRPPGTNRQPLAPCRSASWAMARPSSPPPPSTPTAAPAPMSRRAAPAGIHRARQRTRRAPRGHRLRTPRPRR